jgi:inner membrane protein
LFGAACGLLPDLDMVARLGGEFASLVHHRGITHSLLTLAVVSPLVGYAGYRWAGTGTGPGAEASTPTGAWKHQQWLIWTHLAFWALVTHPLLDLFTTYGTQLLAPLSNHRFALDAVSIVDLACSLPMWGVALWCLIRMRRVPGPRRRWVAVGALVWATCYLLAAYGLSQAVSKRAEKQLEADGFAAVEVRALPTMLVTGAWRVAARNRHGDLRLGLASSWAGRRIKFQAYDRPGDPLVAKALASERGRMFQWFTGGMTRARMERTPGGRRVVLEDARFGILSNLSTAVFGVRFDFDHSGRLQSVQRMGRHMDFDAGHELSVWWRALSTGQAP